MFDLGDVIDRDGLEDEPNENEGEPITDGGAPSEEQDWERCGPGLCTTLEVPVDYTDASQGTLGLRVFFGKAKSQSRRNGVLLFNPGGPGAPVVKDAADYYQLFSEYFPTLDIVLMDNRGMGESEPVDCADAAFLEAGLSDLDATWTADEVDRLADFWGDFSAGCVDRMGASTVANLHSVNVARDMDSVREMLGEERINLWNVSYGTVQASFYGKLFPSHVGGFVLDSPVYFGQATQVDDVRNAIESYDTELGRFLDWCAEDDDCGIGSTPETVRANYDALRALLHEGVAYEGDTITEAVLDSVASGLLMYGDWETFAQVLQEAAQDNWISLGEVASAEVEDPETQLAMLQSNLVVRLLDYGCPENYSREQALQQMQAAVNEHPRIANVYAWHFSICLGWQTNASVPRVVSENLESEPFLLLASAHDAATPLQGAENLVAQLNNESRLLVIDKEGHGVLNTDAYGTTEGIAFITNLNPSEPCTDLDCLDIDTSSLNSLRAPKSVRQPRLPVLAPRPFAPILKRPFATHGFAKRAGLPRLHR